MLAVSATLMCSEKKTLLIKDKLDRYGVDQTFIDIFKSAVQPEEELVIQDVRISSKKDDGGFSISEKFTIEDVLEFENNFKFISFVVGKKYVTHVITL